MMCPSWTVRCYVLAHWFDARTGRSQRGQCRYGSLLDLCGSDHFLMSVLHLTKVDWVVTLTAGRRQKLTMSKHYTVPTIIIGELIQRKTVSQ
eukprot:4263565-Amphidinium_carterae.1